MKSPRVFLQHILDSINHIEQYVHGLSKEEFLTNFLVIDAVVRNIEIIGEASKNIDEDFRKSHQAVPWRDIISMRNMVIHEYFNVDAETVWIVVQSDIPQLKKHVLEILEGI